MIDLLRLISIVVLIAWCAANYTVALPIALITFLIITQE